MKKYSKYTQFLIIYRALVFYFHKILKVLDYFDVPSTS